MKTPLISRRRLLLGAGALVCGSPLRAGPSATPDDAMGDEQRALHALNRLAYGPRPADAAAIRELGAARWLDQFLQQQLTGGPAIPDALQQRLASLKTWQESQGQLGERLRAANQARRARQQAGDKADAGAAPGRHELVRPVLQETAEQRLWRALESPAQLQERLVEFWFNHFNVFVGKGPVSVYVGAYEREAIRPHVLGRFRDMLGATAKHPAMLLYLDNAQSVAPGFHPRRGNARSTGLNENYARELMELHTLGVDGGYTQADVTELARMLTGWTLDPRGLQRGDAQLFAFEPRRHDMGSKHWLGRVVAASGQREGEAALDILAAHPSTARHLSYQFAQAFVADEPPASLVTRLSENFLHTGGDLRAFTETLVRAPEFWQAAQWQAKFKSPYQYLLSSLRALDARIDEPALLLPVLAQAGMPLYGAQTPDGYKTVASAWQSPEALTQRVQLATELAHGRLARRLGVQADLNQVLGTLGPVVQPGTRQTLNEEPSATRLALLLASPDFMHC